MTWKDLVREYLPDAADNYCSFVLWNETSFPLGDIDEIRLHLAMHKCTVEMLCGGPFPDGDEELERGMARIHARQAAELEGA